MLPAQRRFELGGAIAAIHAGNVEHAPLRAILSGQGEPEVQLPVIVRSHRAVFFAMSLSPSAPGVRLHIRGAQRFLVVADGEDAATDIRGDGAHSLDATQLATHLVDAARALGLTRKQQGEHQRLFNHDALDPHRRDAPRGRA